MNKNSIFPIICLSLVVLSIPFCIHDTDSQGYNGPSLFEGMYRGNEGRFIRSLSKGEVEIANTIIDSNKVLAASELTDYRQGIEASSWNNVMIFAEDDHPVTRSVVKGMAELLTNMLGQDEHGFSTPFYLVNVQPHKKKVRPWGVSRVVRIGTVSSDEHPMSIQDEFNAEVSIAVKDPRIPRQVNTYVPLTAGGVNELAFIVKHKITSTGKLQKDSNWANWHASVGRSIACDAIRHCWNGEVEEINWEQLDYDTELGAWRERLPRKDENSPQEFGKKKLLPHHPDHKVLTWHAGWQEPLVRGWTGSIIGVQLQTRMGSVKDTLTKWRDHLDGSGIWTFKPLQDETQLFWKYAGENLNHLQAVLSVPEDYGADIITWQTVDDYDAIYQQWLQLAIAGDAPARTLIRRYLLSKHIDPGLRNEAVALLRKKPHAGELAMIGLHAQASAEERAFADAIAYVRGVSDQLLSTKSLQQETKDRVKQWDKRPLLVRHKDYLLLFLHNHPDKATKQERFQVWSRKLQMGSQAQRFDAIDKRIAIDDVRIEFETAVVGESYDIVFK